MFTRWLPPQMPAAMVKTGPRPRSRASDSIQVPHMAGWRVPNPSRVYTGRELVLGARARIWDLGCRCHHWDCPCRGQTPVLAMLHKGARPAAFKNMGVGVGETVWK